MVNRKISFKIASLLLAISIASQANAISFSGIRSGIANAYSSTVDRAQKLYKKHPKRIAAGAAAGTFAAVTGAALFAQKLLCKKVQELPKKSSFLSKNTLFIGGAVVALCATAYAIYNWKSKGYVPPFVKLDKDEFDKFQKFYTKINSENKKRQFKKSLTSNEINEIDDMYEKQDKLQLQQL